MSEEEDLFGLKEMSFDQIIAWIKEHIKGQQLKDWLPYMAAAILGWQFGSKVSKHDPTTSLTSAGLATIFLRLAEAPNPIAAGAGLAGLATMGIITVSGIGPVEGTSTLEGDFPIEFGKDCPEGYHKVFDPLHGIYWCKRIR